MLAGKVGVLQRNRGGVREGKREIGRVRERERERKRETVMG